MRSMIVCLTVFVSLFSTELIAQCQESRNLTDNAFEAFVKVWKDVKEVERPSDEKLFALAKKYNVKQGSLTEENQERFIREYPEFVSELKRLQREYDERKMQQQITSCQTYGIQESTFSKLVDEYSNCSAFKSKVAQRLNKMRR